MAIIELPAWRLRGGDPPEVGLPRPVMRVVKPGVQVLRSNGFCDRCAAEIQFGAVTNGVGTYCSVECSLEGPGRPA